MADTLKESVLELLLKSPNGLTWEEIANQVSYVFENPAPEAQKNSTFAYGILPLLREGKISATGERTSKKYFAKGLLLKKQVKPEEANLSDLERLLLAYINGDLQVIPAMLDAVEERGAPRPEGTILHWIVINPARQITQTEIEQNMNHLVYNTKLEVQAYILMLNKCRDILNTYIYFGTEASEVKDRILKAHKRS